MLEEIVQDFGEEVKEKAAAWIQKLKETGAYEEVEREVLGWARELCSGILGVLLQGVLSDQEVLRKAKRLGGQVGSRLVSYQEVDVRVGSGGKVKVRSPYFVKASPKRGRKKRGPNGRGVHLLLEVLGFVGRCSSVFVDEVVKMALLCPSLEVAHEVLSSWGMEVDVKTIRRLCGLLGEVGLGHRGAGIGEDGGGRDRWGPASDAEEEARASGQGVEAERF